MPAPAADFNASERSAARRGRLILVDDNRPHWTATPELSIDSHATHFVIKLTLISRSYCHLCDDMLAALKALQPEYRFDIDVIDVDEDAELTAKYDELVPVLLACKNNGRMEELCHYFLDKPGLLAFLSSRSAHDRSP